MRNSDLEDQLDYAKIFVGKSHSIGIFVGKSHSIG
jgi:hypothetical protein